MEGSKKDSLHTSSIPEFDIDFFLSFISEYYNIVTQVSNEIIKIINTDLGHQEIINQVDSLIAAKPETENFNSVITDIENGNPITLQTISDKLELLEKYLSAISNTDFFDTFSLACLSGTYYDLKNLEIEDVVKKINKSRIQLTTLSAQIDLIDDANEDKELFQYAYYDLETSLNKFNECIRLFINLSRRLVFNSESRIQDIQSKHFDLSLNFKCSSLQEIFNNNEHREAVYIINLRLAELDEYLSCNDVFLEELINFYSILELIFETKPDSDLIVKHTRDKCLFLLYKIIRRIDKSSKLTNEGVVINTFYNHNEIELSTSNIEDLINKTLNPYNYFLLKSLIIYPQNSENKEPSSQISSFEELHILAKTLKNNLSSIDDKLNKQSIDFKFLQTNLKKLIKEINKEDTNNKFTVLSFEYLVDNITLIYKLNSILLDFNELDQLETIFTKYLDLIEEYSKHCDFGNNPKLIFPNIQQIRYFVIYVDKLLCKSRDIIKLTRKSVDLNDIEIFEKSISKVVEKTNHLTKKFFSNLQFLKNKNYYPTYNNIDSCKTQNSTSYTIFAPTFELIKSDSVIHTRIYAKEFLDSSYVLPSNYTFLESDMEESIRSINNINSQILSILEVFLTRNVEKQLDSKLKENQFNAIQILSVYAIVITYILGSITALPKFDGGLKILPYFLILVGLMLGFFIICIKFLFINERFPLPFGTGKYRYIPRWIIFLLFMLIIASLVIFFVLPKFENIKMESTKIETRNPINKDSLSIDSAKNKNINSKK